jgi:hypothetical protein
VVLPVVIIGAPSAGRASGEMAGEALLLVERQCAARGQHLLESVVTVHGCPPA